MYYVSFPLSINNITANITLPSYWYKSNNIVYFYYEIVLLERNVRKIKLGLFENAESFPIERSYKLVFKILGIGLLFYP